MSIRKRIRKWLKTLDNDMEDIRELVERHKSLLDRLANQPCNDPICKERDCIVAQMK